MQNLIDPAILFFIFGVLAGFVRSNLEIPPAISRFLSLYLLMALGLKGGFALAQSGLTTEVATSLAAAILLAILVPAMGYWILKRFISGFDAAAIAATYGSVSAAMALMESPAIILAVILANSLRQQKSIPIGKILHESFTDGAQLLLLGAMVVGLMTGEAGQTAMQPFSGDLFKGMLAFFLLDMGLMTARNLPQFKSISPVLILYAVLGPLLHASIALGLALLLNLSPGNATLLMVLAASASYIAVPAVLRYAVPEANPSLYFGLSLGLTFPFNLIIGIPLYAKAAAYFLG